MTWLDRSVGWLLRRGAIAAIALLLSVFLHSRASAGSTSVHLQVEPNPVGTSERLSVSVVVEGEDASDANVANFPLIPGLRRLGGASSSESTSVMIDGGQIRRTTTRTISYAFLPEKAGDVTIPPLDVSVGAKTQRTESVTVHVVEGSTGGGRPRGRGTANDPLGSLLEDPFESLRPRTRPVEIPEMSIRRTASRTQIYVGEPLKLNVELWVGEGEGHIEQAGPVSGTDRTGYWVENLKVDTRATGRTEEHGGKVFTVFTLSEQMLYATEPGRLALPVETWRVVYRPNVLSLLSPAQEIFPKSEETAVEVLALPEAGRPPGFAGLVGDFHVRSELDRERGKIGDAVTWNVTLEGKGNLRTAGELALPKPDGFDVFSSKANDDVQISEQGLQGKRTTEQVLIPRSAGALEVPALRIPYFDVATRAYKIAEAPGHRVLVEGAGTTVPAVALAPSTPAARPVQQGTDIRYIQPASGNLAPARSIATSPGFWILGFLAPVANLGLWLRRRKLLSEGRDPIRQRRRLALGRLEKSLAGVTGDGATALAQVSTALVAFLQDRFGIPSVEVTAARLRERAVEHGVPSRHVEDLVGLLSALDAVRFGGSVGTTADVVARVKQLARYLEEAP